MTRASSTEGLSVAGEAFNALVDWALKADPEALPDEVLDRAGLLVVDSVAALLAASGDPAVQSAQIALCPTDPRYVGSCCWALSPSLSPRQKAVSTAVALSWMELDEGYSRASCHAALYTLPTIAAVADRSGANVRMVLGQMALAYEVLARLAAAYPAERFTWHPHAMWSPVGAALARCLAENIEAEVAFRSLRIAATFSMTGEYQAAIDGAEVRNFWAGIGVTLGFTAVDLAFAGRDGPQGAPETVFARLTGRERYKGGTFGNALGADWAVFDSFTKQHACCQSTHSAIEAALILRRTKGFDVESVEEIEVRTPRTEMDNREPHNRLAAQFSMPHAVAVSLCWGAADADAFSLGAVADSSVRRLRHRVTLVPWEAPLTTPNSRPATVRVRLSGGEVLERTLLQTAEPTLDERRHLIAKKLKKYSGDRFLQAPAVGRRLLDGCKGTLKAEWSGFASEFFSTEC